MLTTILAWVIIALGVISIATGAWGTFILLGRTLRPIPMRYWGFTVVTIAGGVGLIGVGQSLRLLILILHQFH